MSLRNTRVSLERALSGSADLSVARSTLQLGRFIKLRLLGSDDGDMTPEVWAYIGPRAHYLLIPMTYCSCHDFIIRSVAKGASDYCKHLVGLELARRGGKISEIELSPDEMLVVVREILKYRFSQTLRRKL